MVGSNKPDKQLYHQYVRTYYDTTTYLPITSAATTHLNTLIAHAMRSFFNRPTWANVGEEDSRPDFYRRSDQTYGDVTSGGQGERTTADQASAPVVNDGKIANF